MLKDFLNKRVYINNIDMEAIMDAAQPELDTLNRDMHNIFADTFPAVATLTGIVQWENALGITPDPANEPMEFRRGRIINRLSSSLPFTERALQQAMDNIMGVGGWHYMLDYRAYRLDIESLRPGQNWLKEMAVTLEKIIPANIEYFLHILFATWAQIHDDYGSWGELYETGKTWQEVLEA